MNEEVNEVLKQAKELSDKELAARQGEAFSKGSMKDAWEHGRMSYHIRRAENNAADEFYKKYKQNQENLMLAGIFLFIISALLANVVLYFPVYLVLVWSGVNKHDALFISIIVNTVIGMIAWGLRSEYGTSRTSFISGMRAEADNHIVGKYHEAKKQVDKHHASKGHMFDYDSDW